MSYSLLWAILFSTGFCLEAIAIFDKKHNGTLSRKVWLLLTFKLTRMVILAAWAWLTYHWFLEHLLFPFLIHTYLDDIIPALLGCAYGAVVEYKPRPNRKRLVSR